MRALVIALVLAAASVQASTDAIETELRADLAKRGYENVVVDRANGTLHVTCERDGMRLTVMVNAATGEVLSQTLDASGESDPAS